MDLIGLTSICIPNKVTGTVRNRRLRRYISRWLSTVGDIKLFVLPVTSRFQNGKLQLPRATIIIFARRLNNKSPMLPVRLCVAIFRDAGGRLNVAKRKRKKGNVRKVGYRDRVSGMLSIALELLQNSGNGVDDGRPSAVYR